VILSKAIMKFTKAIMILSKAIVKSMKAILFYAFS